jgi:hypothetical protein
VKKEQMAELAAQKSAADEARKAEAETANA